jgi:hypothetical protein
MTLLGRTRELATPVSLRGPEPPGKADDGENHRNDDRQHDRQRIEKDEALGNADGSARIKDPAATG